jgi:hypothetical protein
VANVLHPFYLLQPEARDSRCIGAGMTLLKLAALCRITPASVSRRRYLRPANRKRLHGRQRKPHHRNIATEQLAHPPVVYVLREGSRTHTASDGRQAVFVELKYAEARGQDCRICPETP